MANKKFHQLLDGYSNVIKKDILEGRTVYLRKEVILGIIRPFTNNMVGKFRIGIKEAEKGVNEYHSWVYCAELCKKDEK